MKTALLIRVFVIAAVVSFCKDAAANSVTFTAAGPSAGDIQAALSSFQNALGDLNPNVPTSFASGRREINWDAVPQAASSPNSFPANFFNGTVPGRARGVEFSTPGTGFRVSANAGEGPIQFSEINPIYPALFEPFSPQKLFTAVGSPITDVQFFIPGTSTPALTRGMGVVFSDVDAANTTGLEFFDANGNSIGSIFAPAATGDETFSFAGIVFDSAVVAKVRITSGNEALSAAAPSGDVVAMDDFVFGEQRRVPDGSNTLVLLAGAVVCLLRFVPRASKV